MSRKPRGPGKQRKIKPKKKPIPPLKEAKRRISAQSESKRIEIDQGSRERMLRLGPLINAEISCSPEHVKALLKLSLPVPRPVIGYMIIDTGASQTSLMDNAIGKLNLHPQSKRTTHGVHGPKDVYEYFASVKVGEGDFTLYKTDNFTEVKLSEDVITYYSTDGVEIVGLLGRDFFVDKELICDYVEAKVIILTKGV